LIEQRKVEQRELRVTQMTWEADGVVSVRLARIESDGPLPAWEPGAHIDVYVPDGTTRQYSLCGDPGDLSSWQIAVLREPEGRGGSAYIHDELRVGDRLLVTRPKNNFALEEAPYHALLAGGVGITPMMSMASTWPARAGPSTSRTAVAPSARWRSGRGWPHSVTGSRFWLRTRTAAPTSTPWSKTFPTAGWSTSAGRSHCSGRCSRLPCGARDGPGRRPFRAVQPHRRRTDPRRSPLDADDYELVLAESGHTLRLPPEANILEVVLALGVDVENDCRDGICGSCVTPIRSGTVDHRDLVLTKKERAAMDRMLICVSRPTCPRLELEL
jgi:ferredoxin